MIKVLLAAFAILGSVAAVYGQPAELVTPLVSGSPVSSTNPLPVVPAGSASGGITPVVSASAESSHVLKNAAGNLYAAYATNLTATAGFLQVFNATSAPADGAVTPIECVPLPGNATASITYGSGPPGAYSTGITAVVSSATTCFTKTTGVITAFIHGLVQ